MKTSAELKYFSRQKLNGRYGVTISVTLLLLGCNLALSTLVQEIVAPSGIPSLIAFEVVVFLVDLLLGLLISGRTYLYMNILYDREVSFADIRQGFLEHPEKAVMLQIPFALAATVSTVPLHIYQLFYWESQDRDVLFLCLLVALAGLAIELVVDLVFAQVYYLLHDFPDRSVPELFRASAKLMRGHIGQYFLLLMSYLPGLLVSFLLLFIPALFIISQMNAAQAAFYQALTAPTNAGNGRPQPNTNPWRPYSY